MENTIKKVEWRINIKWIICRLQYEYKLYLLTKRLTNSSDAEVRTQYARTYIENA